MRLIYICPKCNKKSSVESEIRPKGGNTSIYKLTCGHLAVKEHLKISSESVYHDLIFKDGRKLYPFQANTCLFGEKSDLSFLCAHEMGLGKQLSNDSKILTPDGWITHGSVKIGDAIIGSDGKHYVVNGVFPQGRVATFKVSFSDGSFVIAGGEHLWEVNTALRKWQGYPNLIKTTNQLIGDLYTTSTNSSGKKNSKWFIPITEPVELNWRSLPIDPYVLGVLLGGRGLTQENIRLSTEDEEIRLFVESEVFRLGGELKYILEYDYLVKDKGRLKLILEDLGLHGKSSSQKFIPSSYLYSSIEQRIELLRGLLDTDGHLRKDGTVEYCTVSEKLARDVQELVQSLGGICRVSTKIPKYTYKGEKKEGLLAYILIINIRLNPFRLLRKALEFKPKDKYKPTRAIVSIEPFEEKECTCISTSAPNQLYITDSYIVTHNTIIFNALLEVRSQDLLPTAIFCKSGLRRQWLEEILGCLGPKKIQTINGGREFPLKGMEIYIVSLDMLRNLDVDKWAAAGIKSICIDEVQLIKSHESKRTNAVRDFARKTNAKIIGLSGTPIKNNPGEYYPILNLLRPELFPNRNQFIYHWCDYSTSYYGTKVNRLRSPREFKEFTESFIIRYEREEVMPELPKIRRTSRFIDMSQDLDKAYQEVVTEFESFVRINDKDNPKNFSNLLAYFARMRHITGLAKIESVVDFVTEFLLETDRKLVVFLHHKDVHNILMIRLDQFLKDGGYPLTLNLTSDLNGDERHEVVQKFWGNEHRVMIASTLASGEGLNLQICSDAVMMESQWNPANEEQAEARFTRIGSEAEHVNITGVHAVGTIDEFMLHLKAKKKQSTNEALTGIEGEPWNESEMIRELTEMIISKQLKAWSMPKGN